MSDQKSSNGDYGKRDYWNERYREEDSMEWLANFSVLEGLLLKHLKPTDRILILGCGNSSLGPDLYSAGYNRIMNLDYSECVIERMKLKHPDATEMQWLCADVRNLGEIFPPGSFEVIIEKATLDSILVNERNPWCISSAAKDMLDVVLSQVSRLLCDDGVFLSITFAQPHFRLPIYAVAKYDWSVECTQFGADFGYFFIAMRKGQPLATDAIEKLCYARRASDKAANSNSEFLSVEKRDENDRAFLGRIEL